MGQVVRGTDAFGLIFDNLLGLDLPTMRGLTNLYALLYERLIISDSWTLTNAAFQAMLKQRDGVELLRAGVVVPVRRDKFESFGEFLTSARTAEKPMHGLCATDDFAAFLDQEVPVPLTFALKEVGAAYTAMAERVLAEDVLLRFGVSAVSAATVARLLQEAKANSVDWKTNTWVRDCVCPQLSEEDALLVMEIARAPYALNIPANVLHSGIAGPDGFRGDQILAALKGGQRTLGAVGAAPAGAMIEAAFRARMGSALINWLLSSQVLQELTASDLGYARGTSTRQEYLTALTVFLAAPQQSAWDVLVRKLEAYLHTAALEVFNAWRRSDRLKTDPPDGEIVVEGATMIRILRPDRPVELSGVVEAVVPGTVLEVEPVQVIGRTVSIPVREEQEAR